MSQYIAQGIALNGFCGTIQSEQNGRGVCFRWVQNVMCHVQVRAQAESVREEGADEEIRDYEGGINRAL